MKGWFVLISAILLAAGAYGQAPEQPGVSDADGSALVGLARQAMAEYLAHRSNADQIKVPADLDHLRGRNFKACVRLRQDGTEVARAIRGSDDQEDNLCRNVISAALAAMRSPSLPDKVDQEFLSGLTVEVEVLGVPRPVQPGKSPGETLILLERSLVPGLTGLRAQRGDDEGYLLPSEAFARGLEIRAMRGACQAELPLTAANSKLPIRWATFASQHFVGFADGVVVQLFRGKNIAPQGAASEQALKAASARIADFLIRNQDKDGAFALGESGMIEHLQAAYAMTLMCGRSVGERLLTSQQRAIKFASAAVKREAGKAFVECEPRDRRLAATAMLASTLQKSPNFEDYRELHDELVKSLFASIRADGGIAGNMQAAQGSAPLEDLCRAYMALTAAESADPAQAAQLEKFKQHLQAAAATTLRQALWKVRAGVAATSIKQLDDFAPVAAGPRDEIGGLAMPGQTPQVELTALAAMAMDGGPGRVWPRAANTQPQTAKELRSQWTLGARSFCYTMMIRPYEDYFTSPGRLVGGVRPDPTKPTPDLTATAMALEALLIPNK